MRVGGAELLRGRNDGFDWDAALELAAEGTTLKPGDVNSRPGPPGLVRDVEPGSSVEVGVEGVGVLSQRVAL